MEDIIYFQKKDIEGLMKTVQTLLNVHKKMLALEDKMQNINLQNFILDNVQKGMKALFATYVLIIMGKLLKINANLAQINRNF